MSQKISGWGLSDMSRNLEIMRMMGFRFLPRPNRKGYKFKLKQNNPTELLSTVIHARARGIVMQILSVHSREVLCGVLQDHWHDIISDFAGALVEAWLFPLSRNPKFRARHHDVGAWISEGAGFSDEFVAKHVDEWAQGACDEGLNVGAVAGVRRACEETTRRGPVLCEGLF